MVQDRLEVNPEMVTLARQSRGITQGDLARSVGVGQGTISKIEAGLLAPTPDELGGIADALDYPVAFFTQHRGVPGPGLSELFHRKRQSAGVKVLHQIHATAAIQMMAVSDLLRSKDLAVDIPILPIDEFDADPEKIARTVRALWQVPPGPVFNVTSLLEEHGGVVVLSQFGSRHVDGFSRRENSDMRPFFFMSDALPPDRWRFTLVHELGHMVMHIEATSRRFPGRSPLKPATATPEDLVLLPVENICSAAVWAQRLSIGERLFHTPLLPKEDSTHTLLVASPSAA